APFYIAARATSLGCFAGGYPANAKQSAQGARLGGGQALPIIVALAILVVVLAGIPLAVMRRRAAAAARGDESGPWDCGSDAAGGAGVPAVDWPAPTPGAPPLCRPPRR